MAKRKVYAVACGKIGTIVTCDFFPKLTYLLSNNVLEMKKRTRTIIIAGTAGLGSLFLIVCVWIGMYLQSPLPVQSPQELHIPTPPTMSATLQSLEGCITSPRLFSWCIAVYGGLTDATMYPGDYRVSPKTTHLQLLRSLFTKKQSVTVNISFPEGITVKQFASIAQAKAGIDSAAFMAYCFSDSVLQRYGVEHIEGYIMPNTYNVFWKHSPRDLVERLLTAQDNIWSGYEAEARRQRRSRHEILTLASIVEAEAVVAHERKRIAGVYMNRLRRNMKLDADPTVQYAVGGKKRLRYADLQSDNPYNTYKFKGLPPGPINSPSAASIEAALFPEKHSFLYFVAKGNGSGEHNFSTNYAQHTHYVSLYRKNRNK